jgi:hypothetical protein
MTETTLPKIVTVKMTKFSILAGIGSSAFIGSSQIRAFLWGEQKAALDLAKLVPLNWKANLSVSCHFINLRVCIDSKFLLEKTIESIT